MGAYVYTMRADSRKAYSYGGSVIQIGRIAYAGKPYGYEWQDGDGESPFAKRCNREIRKAVGVAKRVFAHRSPPTLYVAGDKADNPFTPFAPVYGEWEESRRWSYDSPHPAIGFLKATGNHRVPWELRTEMYSLERYHLGCPDASFNDGPGTPCSQEAQGDRRGHRTNTRGEPESYVSVERTVVWTREAAERLAAACHKYHPLHGVLLRHSRILPEVNCDPNTRSRRRDVHLLYEPHQIPRCNAHTLPPPPPPLTADERLGAAFDHFLASTEV